MTGVQTCALPICLAPYGAPEDDGEKVVPAKTNEVKGLRNFVAVLKMSFTWKQIAHNIFYFVAYNAVNSFLPMAIMSAGYTRAEAGLVVTVYNVFQLIAMFVWGSLARGQIHRIPDSGIRGPLHHEAAPCEVCKDT